MNEAAIWASASAQIPSAAQHSRLKLLKIERKMRLIDFVNSCLCGGGLLSFIQVKPNSNDAEFEFNRTATQSFFNLF